MCTRCYSRHFGPGGLGQELDISGRYRTDTVKAGPGCPVCHGAVFDAEKVDTISNCDARKNIVTIARSVLEAGLPTTAPAPAVLTAPPS